VQLDVGCRLYVARDDPEQVSLVDQLGKELVDSRQHLVALGVLHRLVEVEVAALHQPRELSSLGLPLQDRLECLPPDHWIGHADVRELADVGLDSVELVEGKPPGGSAGTTRVDQGAVDVEEDREICRAGCPQPIFAITCLMFV